MFYKNQMHVLSGVKPPDFSKDAPSTHAHVLIEERPKAKKPTFYKVLLLNDDYTPMEFVVFVLKRFFHKTDEEATQIMLKVHTAGLGVCGIYPLDVAETKVLQVLDSAKQHEHPLQCTIERE